MIFNLHFYFPVAKPLVVDGTTKSHQLFLAYDHVSLSELEPPLLLQEFVNHGIYFCCYLINISVCNFLKYLCSTYLFVGGVLFKIYVIGETMKVVRRFSLPNVSNCELAKVAGVFRFPRVSSAAASADDADLEPGIAGEMVDLYYYQLIDSLNDLRFKKLWVCWCESFFFFTFSWLKYYLGASMSLLKEFFPNV